MVAHCCCCCCSSRWLLAFALCAAGIASAILYASIGPDSWVVYSNLAFLVPAAAAILRHRRWLVCGLFLLTGAASVAYHNTAVTESSSLRQLQQTDHVAALYITAVVLTLPFVPTRDSQLANGVALALGAGATVTAVWFTLETDLEPVTSVAVTLGTLLLGHWLQLVFAVARLGDEWRRAQAWNLVLQAVPPVAIGVPLGLVYAWNPYTVASIFGVALLWPFMLQSILAKQSGAWPDTSLGRTARRIDLHPFKAATFILVTLLLGASALTLLWTPETTNDWQWHGLWHVLAAATATFVVWNSPAPFTAYAKLQDNDADADADGLIQK
jgi:hypothetical protein